MGYKLKPLEKEIQNSICEYLTLRRNLLFWRQNTAPTINKDTGTFRRMAKYTKTGVPDIIVVKNGIFIGLEVKREGQKQSENQIEFQKELERVGGKYFVVSSVIDVINIGL